MQYVVKHPNYDGYLLKLDKPIKLSHDDMGIEFSILHHEWVSDKERATYFNTRLEARNNFTSPLCDIITIY